MISYQLRLHTDSFVFSICLTPRNNLTIHAKPNGINEEKSAEVQLKFIRSLCAVPCALEYADSFVRNAKKVGHQNRKSRNEIDKPGLTRIRRCKRGRF